MHHHLEPKHICISHELSQSRPTTHKAYTGTSGQNTVLGRPQRFASRLQRSLRLNWW